jgi:hypothetical protein
MVDLTDNQMKHIASIYHLIGDKLMLSTFLRPYPLELFEMDFVKISVTPEDVDNNIKAWARIALALDRWRIENNYEFEAKEERRIFSRLILLSAGKKLREEFAEEEDRLLEYLLHPLGDEE